MKALGNLPEKSLQNGDSRVYSLLRGNVQERVMKDAVTFLSLERERYESYGKFKADTGGYRPIVRRISTSSRSQFSYYQKCRGREKDLI